MNFDKSYADHMRRRWKEVFVHSQLMRNLADCQLENPETWQWILILDFD